MAKRRPAHKVEQCPVTDEECKKSCAPDECKATVSEEVAGKSIAPDESSSSGSDLENHPKFAKFKKGRQST